MHLPKREQNTPSTLTASYFEKRNLALCVGDAETIKASACKTDAWYVWVPNDSCYLFCSVVPVLWNDNEDCLKMPASLDILAEFWALSMCVSFVDNKFGLAFAFWLFDLQFMGILAMVGNFWPLLDVGWFTESGLQTSQPQHYKFT